MLGAVAALFVASIAPCEGMPPPLPARISTRDAAVIALVVQKTARGPRVCVALQNGGPATDIPPEVVRRAGASGVTILSLSQCGGPDLVIHGVRWKGRTATVAVSRHPCVGWYTVKRRLGVLGWRVTGGGELCE